MTSHDNQHSATSNPTADPPQPPDPAEIHRFTADVRLDLPEIDPADIAWPDAIPPEVIDVAEQILDHLAQTFLRQATATDGLADAFHAIEAQASHLLIGFISLADSDDLPGIVEDGEYWPDAHHVTFTEPEPAEPRLTAPRSRLQDWLDASGEVLDAADRPVPSAMADYFRDHSVLDSTLTLHTSASAARQRTERLAFREHSACGTFHRADERCPWDDDE